MGIYLMRFVHQADEPVAVYGDTVVGRIPSRARKTMRVTRYRNLALEMRDASAYCGLHGVEHRLLR